MARYTLVEPDASYHGKTCKHSELINCQRRETGTNYTTKICHPRDYKKNPLSASEQAAQEKFKQAAQTARGEMRDPDKKEAALQRWQAAGKKGTLYSFLFKEAYAKI